MSLKAIAEEGLARLKAGETEHETERETRLKQVKQDNSCFTGGSAGFTPMKHGLRNPPIMTLVSLFHSLGVKRMKQACRRPLWRGLSGCRR